MRGLRNLDCKLRLGDEFMGLMDDGRWRGREGRGVMGRQWGVQPCVSNCQRHEEAWWWQKWKRW